MHDAQVKSLVLSTLLTMSAISVNANELGSRVEPNDYPRMTAKEIGYVRHIARLSRSPRGDWTEYGSGFLPVSGTAQFHLSFMALAMQLAQHELTPAYREIYQSTIENMLTQLQRSDTWGGWQLITRYGSVDSTEDEQFDWMTNPGWIDPILKDNIMFKAYVLEIAAAYQMLYGDKRYDQPGAFTFKWGAGLGNGPITFRYTMTDIAKNIYQEYVDSNFVGSACEPGDIFWICQGPSNAGFIMYDQMYGTHYADALPKMRAKWVEEGFRDPKTYTNVLYVRTGFKDPSKNVVPRTPLWGIDGGEEGGWGALYNVGWDLDYARAMYLAHRDEELDRILTGKKFMMDDPAALNLYPSSGEGVISATQDSQEMLDGQAFQHLHVGFFFAYAAEMGDRHAKDALFAYAERNYNPIWHNGEYYYPRNDDYRVDKQGNVHGVDPWTGNALIPLASFDRGGGLRKLYTEPWGEAHYRQPYISDVDTTTVGVSQAFFDAKKNALIVTLLPGPIVAKQVSFVVRQLDPARTYSVRKDGKPVGELRRDLPSKNVSMAWRDDGTALISTSITTPHTFVLVGK